MNSLLWLETLRSSIKLWRRSKNCVHVASTKIMPPASGDLVDKTQRQLALTLPEDLAAFYREAAGACDIQFSIELPSHLELACGECSISTFGGAFGLLPLGKLAKTRRDWCDLLESLPNEDPASLQMFLRFGIPIWVDRGSNFLVHVTRDAGPSAGIYYMDYSSLGETESHPKVADSFISWLDFLEQSCYPKPGFEVVELWHDGHKLVPNEAHRQQIFEAIRLNQPRAVSMIDAFVGGLSSDGALKIRFEETAKRNPIRKDEDFGTWLPRIIALFTAEEAQTPCGPVDSSR